MDICWVSLGISALRSFWQLTWVMARCARCFCWTHTFASANMTSALWVKCRCQVETEQTDCVSLDSKVWQWAFFWVWSGDDTQLHIWAMQMGGQCTHVLFCWLWLWQVHSHHVESVVAAPLLFCPPFVFTVGLHIKTFSPGWLTTPVLWQRLTRVVSTRLYFQALWCLCLASKFPSL